MSMARNRRTVLIVGGGFGGLSAACYLADSGFDVTLLEKNETLGGLASTFTAEGFQFDSGPTWYMMPDVFARFFTHFDRSPADYYWLKRLDPSYRVYYKDGDSLDVTTDRQRLKAQFEAREAGAGEALDNYLAAAKRTYDISMEKFVYPDRPNLRDWVGSDVFDAGAVGFQLWGSLDDYAARFFDDPKLRQIVEYTAVFLGGDPGTTPRLYNMMSHIDLTQGVYYPEGGIGGLVDAVAELARDLGADIRTGVEVTEITRGRDGFFVVANDRVWRPDAVVSDVDYAYTELELLPAHQRQYDRSYWEGRTYGPSAFVVFLGVERELPGLEHHNVIMPVEWDDHFADIYERGEWPSDPVYYVCNAAKTDPNVAPEGMAALSLSSAIPAGAEDTQELREQHLDRLLSDLAETTGVDIRDDIVFERTMAVSDFADRYNVWQGSLGLAQSLRQTGPFRPRHRSRTVEGLYFAGSSTSPGVGIPICLISGEQAANALLHDY